MKLVDQLKELLNESDRPKKGDKVINRNAGRALQSGKVAPDHGIVNKVSSGYVYVDFGMGSFSPIHLSELEPISKGLWKEK